jgi:type I restriction enzyme S subunit
MIDGFKPYPTIKDSGVPWLAEVPTHWQLRRLKYLLRERDARSVEGTEQLLRVSQYSGVTERRQADGGDEPDTRAESLAGYKLVEPGDLIVNIMLAWNGSMGVSPFTGIASPAYCVYQFGTPAQPWYFHHLLRSPMYKARIKAMSTGVVESRLRLYTDDLYRLEALLPPLPEQSAIVRFLDHADRRIRRYIRAKQKLINLLEEQKQAIIHRAVTRGLDPNVRLKPSGVEWLGDVPEHWEVVRLGRILKERGETNDQGTVTDVLSLLRDRGVIPYNEKGNIGNKKSDDITRYKIVRPDDIVLNCMNVIIGSVGLSAYTGCLSPVYYVLVRRGEDSPQFLNAIFQTPRFHRSLVRIGNGILAHRMRIPMELLKCEFLPRPPIAEQRDIAGFIDQTTAALTAALISARREIDLLREYRTRLIADVVTGRLDVRETAARLPDDGEEFDPIDGESETEVGGAEDADEMPEETER